MSRFVLYVKAASDKESIGDCPFSQRAMMYAQIKMAPGMYEIKPVDISNKTEEFIKLNPEGKVPVLIDRENENKVIADSAEITKYIDSQISEPDCRIDYSGPAVEACSGVFSKFAAYLKNKDESKSNLLKDELILELKKMDSFLESRNPCCKFLLCDNLSEIDCMILPRLRHVIVAGGHYKKFEIPNELKNLTGYIKNGDENPTFRDTRCDPEEIIKGWNRHFVK